MSSVICSRTFMFAVTARLNMSLHLVGAQHIPVGAICQGVALGRTRFCFLGTATCRFEVGREISSTPAVGWPGIYLTIRFLLTHDGGPKHLNIRRVPPLGVMKSARLGQVSVVIWIYGRIPGVLC